MNDRRFKTQVLVIGGGVAGLTTALTLAWKGLEVCLLTADDQLMTSGNTPLAQGGIVFTSPDDSPRLLQEDMMIAGVRHNHRRAVNFLSTRGPGAVREILLERVPIPFARREDGSFDLTREGGHRVARILHCADYTGLAIMQGLADAASAHPNITVMTRRTAVDLLTSHHHSGLLAYKYQLDNQCLGAYVFNELSGQVETMFADFTVLAAGGLGQIFLHTTNSTSSIGSGLAMASRAGVKLMNSEFMQFHPTAFLHRSHRRFLISEAVRGEGAKLVNAKGEPFMPRYDSRADLAPRDVVTRAIQEEMLRTGENNVFLDAAHYVKHDLKARFPTIHKRCLEAGIDIEKEPIPVVPAAHYFCGGVLVDLNGRSTLSRLYSVGESSCTGVHGANRLASTSLLEGVLWGQTAGQDIAKRFKHSALVNARLRESIPDWVDTGHDKNEDPALIAQDWATIRTTMWNYVGIARTGQRLRRAFEDLRDLNRRIHDFYKESPVSKPIVDLFHGCQAAYMVTVAAMLSKHSSGCHYRVDKL